jgi:hypothetical protein
MFNNGRNRVFCGSPSCFEKLLDDRHGIHNGRIHLGLGLDGLRRLQLDFQNLLCIVACLLGTSVVKEEFSTAVSTETPFRIGNIEGTDRQFFQELVLGNVVILKEIGLSLACGDNPRAR